MITAFLIPVNDSVLMSSILTRVCVKILSIEPGSGLVRVRVLYSSSMVRANVRVRVRSLQTAFQHLPFGTKTVPMSLPSILSERLLNAHKVAISIIIVSNTARPYRQ